MTMDVRIVNVKIARIPNASDVRGKNPTTSHARNSAKSPLPASRSTPSRCRNRLHAGIRR